MSLQQDYYLQHRANGATMMTACVNSGIDLAEARLIEAAIAKGELELPRARARAREDLPEEELVDTMDDTLTATKPNETQPSEWPLNRPAEEETTTVRSGNVSSDKLRLFIERVENVEAEIRDLNSDKSDIYQEAKDQGFDTPTMKRIIKLRKMEPQKLREASDLLDTYMHALGMTPIEQAIAAAG